MVWDDRAAEEAAERLLERLDEDAIARLTDAELDRVLELLGHDLDHLAAMADRLVCLVGGGAGRADAPRLERLRWHRRMVLPPGWPFEAPRH